MNSYRKIPIFLKTLVRNKSTFRSVNPQHNYLFNNEVMDLLDNTVSTFKDRHQNLLLDRNNRLNDIFEGKYRINFREDTTHIRQDEGWKGAEITPDLACRHVELTGPASDSKMFINALNSKADGYMADIEDSNSPSWNNIVASQHNIYHGIRKTLSLNQNGKSYSINNDKFPTLWVRTRGLHLKEFNVLDSQGEPYPGIIFDLVMHYYHNASYLAQSNIDSGQNIKGPYIYIPKLETYEEALLVNDLIQHLESSTNVKGTKVTALIETLPAIFQTQEIIYALRNYMVGLNCGRWDYLFGYVKNNLKDAGKILPDRRLLDMNTSFMQAYVEEIVSSTHKRGIHAMGGMSAFIPGKNQDENIEIMNKITLDKTLEIERGCDGAWVAHPGLINPVKELFLDKLNNKDNQITLNSPVLCGVKTDYQQHEELLHKRLTQLDATFTSPKNYTMNGLQTNVNITLQYLSGWLTGNGAVGINNMMEDLATAEISSNQIRQWLYHGIDLYDGNNFIIMDQKVYQNVLLEELESLNNSNLEQNQKDKLYLSSQILTEYVSNINYQFLPDIAYKFLRNNNLGIQFTEYDLKILRGSHPNLTGVELTKYRGEYLNNYLSREGKGKDRNNYPFYQFLGTSTGVSAVNVVAGGKGHVGPYAGGWQTNAMKNRLSELLPDTLHVTPEEPANCAVEINNHLQKADNIQHLRETQIFNELQSLNDEDRVAKLKMLEQAHINYYDTALLADMEQGWSTPEKMRMSVKRAIDNGINVIHVEDQGPKKRCGHLGDKELDTIESYCMILKSGNLAAHEKLGPEQSSKHWVRFVARTDAFSAKRIVYSENMENPNHSEHKFIDWDKGTSPDGKYLYLKQGINPETGKKYGLELSIQRGAEVVKRGLATHVWMETPDAELQDAQDFIFGVNKLLEPYGLVARGLYNHSPSFDWDIKFYKDAIPLADEILKHVGEHQESYRLDYTNLEHQIDSLRNFIKENGNLLKGDDMFSDDYLLQILINSLDYYKGQGKWQDEIINQKENVKKQQISIYNFKQKQELDRILKYGFDPLHHIRNIIVAQRLKSFEIKLASFGYDMHLITLPEFHVLAHNMHQLAKEFKDDGIFSYVKLAQRPERKKSEIDSTYTYYKHQTATGTGVEAIFNSIVGSHDTNTLSQSTESDDIKKRQKK